MKIFKKIGIGCLALLICFCSCFKFVNAEILSEPVYLETDVTYTFVIRNQDISQEDVLVASNSSSEMIIYFPNYLRFMHIDSNNVETYTDATLTYLKEDNIYTYYSFVYPVVESDYLYEDTVMFYFETYQPISTFSVYDTIYDLVETYIFGGNIEKGSHQDLTATTLSSIICVLVFALPFLIIWKVIKVIMG